MDERVVTLSAGEVQTLRRFASAGRVLLADLRAEIMRIGRILGEPDAAAYAAERAESVEELRRLRDIYRGRWDAHLPPAGRAQLPSGEPGSQALYGDGANKRILDALGVTPEMLKRTGEHG